MGEEVEFGDLFAGSEGRRQQLVEEVVSALDGQNLDVLPGSPQLGGKARRENLEASKVSSAAVEDQRDAHRSPARDRAISRERLQGTGVSEWHMPTLRQAPGRVAW